MAALRPLREYAAPSRAEPHSSIAPPAIEANNFELKPSLVQAVQQNQFSGSPVDDPNLHLSVFVQYADTVKANNVSSEAIRLRLFPFSLRDRARVASITAFQFHNYVGRIEESFLSKILSA